jgi:DNA-binding response OmpR family regulator
MRVLVIEDHAELADTVALGLQREGMAVDIALDGAEGLRKAAVYDYDVIVLDRDLPGVHGDRVCETLVNRHAHPPDVHPPRARVLMLTASAGIEDRVAGLSLGADDYLPKPFAFAELIARVRALARRAQPALAPIMRSGDLTLDTGRRIAHRAGRRLDLTAKELAVLELLLAARSTVVSPEQLLARAWDEAVDPFSAVVKVTISRLRRKLGEPPIIVTVPGAGYRI